MTIERGQKVCFVGRNGEGKSTMVKAIMGQIDFQGTCQLGHNVKIGYFAQNQASLLDPERTVFKQLTMWQKVKSGHNSKRFWDVLCFPVTILTKR